MADSSLDMSELAKAAKKKLQAVCIVLITLRIFNYMAAQLIRFFFFSQLSNHLFEELAMDVYDEVDRRENNQSKYKKWAMISDK